MTDHVLRGAVAAGLAVDLLYGVLHPERLTLAQTVICRGGQGTWTSAPDQSGPSDDARRTSAMELKRSLWRRGAHSASGRRVVRGDTRPASTFGERHKFSQANCVAGSVTERSLPWWPGSFLRRLDVRAMGAASGIQELPRRGRPIDE